MGGWGVFRTWQKLSIFRRVAKKWESIIVPKNKKSQISRYTGLTIYFIHFSAMKDSQFLTHLVDSYQ